MIVLTARDGFDVTVTVLESGADDYVTKPFRFEELLARIKVQMRGLHGQQKLQSETVLRVGDLSLILISRLPFISGRTGELSARLFALA